MPDKTAVLCSSTGLSLGGVNFFWDVDASIYKSPPRGYISGITHKPQATRSGLRNLHSTNAKGLLSVTTVNAHQTMIQLRTRGAWTFSALFALGGLRLHYTVPSSGCLGDCKSRFHVLYLLKILESKGAK